MGRGGDGRAMHRTPSMLERLNSLETKLEAKQKLQSLKNDMLVLKNIWFNRLRETDDHAERLEGFYQGQAHAYDSFRSKFLWGRRPMLAACAARLRNQENMVWVDLGGGTGENVALMSSYIDLSRFKHIYVVDLCKSLCAQARKKVQENGWRNVTVVEGDACQWAPPQEACATLVTFSYSLSMIPPFHAAVDRAISYLDRQQGLLGVCDFYTSSKYDLPLRQQSWMRRFFWRSVFDTDNIDIGPERRQYLDHQLSRVWEFNDEGSIPYVPFLRAPFYVWVGRVPRLETLLVENKVEAPAFFPPSFLYTQSWEDPRADEPHLQINEDDVCLTLTSGGCNSLHLCINGANKVYSVDCNPAQSALLELKRVAIRQLGYEDVWALFGEGRIFERDLAPFLSQSALRFWRARLHYFADGLYYHGGMGKVVRTVQSMAGWLGMGRGLRAVANAASLEEQRREFEALWVVRLLRAAPAWAVSLIADCAALLLFNRVTLWFGGGIPFKQYQLILKDGVHISDYAARTFAGVAHNTHLRSSNFFYYNCLTGTFARDNCPTYLTPKGFEALKNGGALEALSIVNGFFLPTLRARKYTKVILMDHLDWLSDDQTREVAAALAEQVPPGGRVIWRSAAYEPPYARFIREAGFEVRCVQRADRVEWMDRVNMYASFWVAVRSPAGKKRQATFTHGGRQHTVHSLLSAEDAALARDVLMVKASVGAGLRDLFDLWLALTSCAPAGFALPVGAGAELAALSFGALVNRLQACVANQREPTGGDGIRLERSAGRTLLHAAACLGDEAITQLLLSLAPGLATTADEDGRTPLFEAARCGQGGAARLLLAAAPEAASMPGSGDMLPLHLAAMQNDGVQLYLEAAPAAALARDDMGCTPLWGAAFSGCTEAATLLLRAAPQSALLTAVDDALPAHAAAVGGHADVLRLLLRAAPSTASAADRNGWTPLALASEHGHVEAMQLLLEAAPESAAFVNPLGCVPLHVAAANGRLAAVELLLKAAPGTAAARNEAGSAPLHDAASCGHAEVVRALLRAAPQAAAMRDEDGDTPLEAALWVEQAQIHAARCLLTAGPAAEVLGALAAAAQAGFGGKKRKAALLPLFADCVAARATLSEAEWALVPTPCPGLGAALPAVLQRSVAQAARLVKHLPAGDTLRLHNATLCLARAQRRDSTELPPPLVWQVLSLCLAP